MTSDKLDMNAWAERRLLRGQRQDIERAIPDGYRMTVMAGMGVGDWSIRLYDVASGALAVVSRHHATIKGGAFAALAKLAAIEPDMTVTVDLDGTPTLHGWEK